MTLFYQEFVKTAMKWRTYIGFIAIAVVVPLVEFGLKFEGGGIIKNMTKGISQDFLVLGNLFNGFFITQLIMNSLWIHVPFLITLVAGDMLAGEATGGTYRLLLTRPVSRTRILVTKFALSLGYASVLVVFMVLLSLGLGLLLFGTGDLLVVGKDMLILAASDVPPRMVLSFGLAIVSMWCVASLSFLFSSLVENAIGPIVGTMAVIIVCFVVSSMDISLFATIKPYLFTTYMNVWRLATDDPIPWDEVYRSLSILLGYSAGFFLVSWLLFVRKDILS